MAVPPERIETQRLTLRRWLPTDAPLREAAAAEGDLNRSMNDWPWSYAIFSRDEAQLYGGIGLHPLADATGMEIAFWLQPSWRGNGFATEAVKAMTEAAFALPDIARVQIRWDAKGADTTKADAVVRRAGFRQLAAEDGTLVWENTRSRAVAQIAAKKRRVHVWRPMSAMGRVVLILALVAALFVANTIWETQRAERSSQRVHKR